MDQMTALSLSAGRWRTYIGGVRVRDFDVQSQRMGLSDPLTQATQAGDNSIHRNPFTSSLSLFLHVRVCMWWWRWVGGGMILLVHNFSD